MIEHIFFKNFSAQIVIVLNINYIVIVPDPINA